MVSTEHSIKFDDKYVLMPMAEIPETPKTPDTPAATVPGHAEEYASVCRGCRLFKEVFAQAAECHCEKQKERGSYLLSKLQSYLYST